jgi:rubrerythrin
MGINSVGTCENRCAKGVSMLDEAHSTRLNDGDYVEFLDTGTTAVGEYHCSSCGYGVTVHSALPRCPMCAGTTWEPSAWSPFKRAAGRLQ